MVPVQKRVKILGRKRSYKDPFGRRDATHKCSSGSNTLSEKLHILIPCENTAYQLLATGQTVFIRINQIVFPGIFANSIWEQLLTIKYIKLHLNRHVHEVKKV